MMYIIGGAPRCGKTKLAKKLSSRLNIPIYSTDELRVRRVKEMSVNEVNLMFPFEKMFNGDKVDECFRKHNAEDFLNADKIESNSLFKEIFYFIQHTLRSKNDFIIEGVHLLPCYINEFKLSKKECRVLYLVKVDEVKILNGLKLNRSKKDWIIGHIKKSITLIRASKMVSVYGKYFVKESNKYNIPFINTEENFFKKLKEAENFFIK